MHLLKKRALINESILVLPTSNAPFRTCTDPQLVLNLYKLHFWSYQMSSRAIKSWTESYFEWLDYASQNTCLLQKGCFDPLT